MTVLLRRSGRGAIIAVSLFDNHRYFMSKTSIESALGALIPVSIKIRCGGFCFKIPKEVTHQRSFAKFSAMSYPFSVLPLMLLLLSFG